MKKIVILILIDLILPNEKSADAQSLILQDSPVIEMTHSWSYRWGDSPCDSSGIPLWIYDSTNLWRSIALPDLPKDRAGRNNLWMRTSLPAVSHNDPCLYINSFVGNCEVFLDNKLIYTFGDIDALGQGKFVGYRIHLISLPHEFQSKYVFFRIYSDHPNKIGIENKVWLGARHDLVLMVVRDNLDVFVLGCFITFIGLFCVFIFFKEHVHIAYLSFGASAICAGLLVVVRNEFMDLIFDVDVAWKYNIEIICLFLTPTALTVFIEQNFRRGPSVIFRRIWQVFLLYAIGALSLWVFNIIPLASAVFPFQCVVIMGITVIITVLVYTARKGSRIAKMFNLSVVLLSVFGAHDILAEMGLIPDWHELFPWGLLIFIIFIGYVLERRFALTAVRREQERSKLLEAEFRVQTAEFQAKLADAQAQTIRSERMASLGRLTAGIAHEIKNPLNFVNNFSELSLERLKELKSAIRNLAGHEVGHIEESIQIISELEENQSKINEHGKRADTIIKGMLLHARGGTGQKILTDINALLDEYLKLTYHGYRAKDPTFNMTLTKQFDLGLPHIEVIPQDMGRVFTNIISNGFYSASEKKREQESSAENIKAEKLVPEITVSSKNLGKIIEIRIRDNGKGIPESIRDKMFVPFFTTKPAGVGTGLGLSISYDIVVNGHSGSITVESKEGDYAEFVITLPKS